MFELIEWCPKLAKASPDLVALYQRALWGPACAHATAIATAATQELHQRTPAPEWRVVIAGLLRELWASPLTSPTEVVLAYMTLSAWLRAPSTTWNEGYDAAFTSLKQFQQLLPVAEAINRARPSEAHLVTLIRERLAKTVPADEALLQVNVELAQGRALTAVDPAVVEA